MEVLVTFQCPQLTFYFVLSTNSKVICQKRNFPRLKICRHRNMKNELKWKTIAGVLLFICSLFLAVYLFSLPARSTTWDLHEKGAVGDAINGMTAPIIAIVGAILVYISFQEQVKANKLQFNAINQQAEIEIVYKLYSELKEDFKEIQDVYGNRHQQPAILDSFMQQVIADASQHSFYNDLHVFIKYLNDQFVFLASRLMVNSILSNDEKMTLIEKLQRLYGLYFRGYYLNIKQSIYQSQLSREFKSDIELVTSSLNNLDQYYHFLLDEKKKEVMTFAEKQKKKRKT